MNTHQAHLQSSVYNCWPSSGETAELQDEREREREREREGRQVQMETLGLLKVLK